MSKTYSYTKTVVITPEEAYAPLPVPRIPEGYEVTDFRPVLGTDTWLCAAGEVVEPTGSAGVRHRNLEFVRFILKVVPPAQETVSGEVCLRTTVQDVYGVPQVTLPRGWKFKTFRVPGEHEKFLAFPQSVGVLTCFGLNNEPRIIVVPQV